MKKSLKPIVAYLLFVLIVGAIVVVGYVSIKLECEVLTKKIVLTEDELLAVNNKQISLIAEVQYLTSEEIIVPVAHTELGMIKRTNPVKIVVLEKSKVEGLEMFLNEKYE